MKRRVRMLVVAAAAVTTVFTPQAADAQPSDVCRDGGWPELQLIDDPLVPAYLGVEYRLPDGAAQHLTLCFKDRSGATGTGGFFHVAVVQAWEAFYVQCGGDLPAVVAVNCLALADINTTDAIPGPGTAADGYVHVQGISATILTTGVEAGTTFTDTSSTLSLGHTGTCAWANGTQYVPWCNATAAEVHAEPNDVVPATGAAGGIPVCVGLFVGGNCVGTWVTVSTNPTVAVGTDGHETAGFTVLGVGAGHDIAYTCIGATAPC